MGLAFPWCQMFKNRRYLLYKEGSGGKPHNSLGAWDLKE